MSYAEQRALGANLRNVWTMASSSYQGEKGQETRHFAQFPPELVELCLLPGTSAKGACAACGAPYVRLEDDTGWGRSCTCETDEIVPCTVLDPFGGAGTTALVADRLGRDCVLIELNPDYVDMARARIDSDAPLFPAVEEKEATDEQPGLGMEGA